MSTTETVLWIHCVVMNLVVPKYRIIERQDIILKPVIQLSRLKPLIGYKSQSEVQHVQPNDFLGSKYLE